MRTYFSEYTPHIQFLWIIFSLATVATLILVACGSSSNTSGQPGPTATIPPTSTQSLTPVATSNIKIVEKGGQYSFAPATLTIKVGTQVIWTNASDAPHTVTSDTGVFNTPNNLEEKQTFKVVFTKPGTYTYYCNIHTYMKGTIIVKS